ncbi:DNA-binding transcriptional regulator, MurR/RpiR family, contains HTH and SIS domains [Terribacillus saccharophilus]|uniref:DNA-binding transcriptional regulator, MurR/RpiR family, contains HTH and SIS domains n=1 Tax=Terribacillus saccharophilus TaxID=361277 RepID=A0A075LLT7_9BACI|nr:MULTISPECIES: MurR/RpiR family transcriptional regulator [Terribacillus]AIF65408.1 hypothetical protein GZ22_01195 [Terribacillus goriensis]MCM3227173.1 MurR/RpiR family transcriptional regulator [Terribacillus saccharophilus]MEC0284178.1 MurR/RpiR family transcriptional regulator [Terribacillus saccharophilus]MEC0289724.1 MurR/RpiR family transcriptional regulator [Terribacillus saccharophilus]SEN72591.1 DNA-binding transcriptional regulator, MurR/RpiR family, contains HTH and SIS domains 
MPDIYHRISSQREQMSKSQKKIANFIIEHPNQAPFLNVEGLANAADVSDATIVRFAAFMGYRGFPEMQLALQNAMQEQLSATERFKHPSEEAQSEDQDLYAIFLRDQANIQETMEAIDMQAFHAAADTVINSKRIFILANRSAVSVADLLHYHLSFIFENVEIVEPSDRAIDQISTIREDDALIALSFVRYSNHTLRLFQMAKDRGAKAIAITDGLSSPLLTAADYSFMASSKSPSLTHSLTAPISLIHAFIALIGKEKAADVKKRLRTIEEAWRDFNVFSNFKPPSA